MDRLLGPGSSGIDVVRVQVALNAHQITVGLTGTFDAATAKAVMKFQKLYGLLPTGVVDRVTSALLFPFRTLLLSVSHNTALKSFREPFVKPIQPDPSVYGLKRSPESKPPARPLRVFTEPDPAPESKYQFKPNLDLLKGSGVPLLTSIPSSKSDLGVTPEPYVDPTNWYEDSPEFSAASLRPVQPEDKDSWVFSPSFGSAYAGAWWPTYHHSQGGVEQDQFQAAITYRTSNEGSHLEISLNLALSLVAKRLIIPTDQGSMSISYQVLYADPSQIFVRGGWHLLNPFIQFGPVWNLKPATLAGYAFTVGNQVSFELIKDRLFVVGTTGILLTYDTDAKALSVSETSSVALQANF